MQSTETQRQDKSCSLKGLWSPLARALYRRNVIRPSSSFRKLKKFFGIFFPGITLTVLIIGCSTDPKGVHSEKPIEEKDRKNPNWGTMRSLISNIVTGVSQGFSKTL